jgi:protein-ribulosamine 3-kinase
MDFYENTIRRSIEETVSKFNDTQWRIKTIRDLSDLACHPCALLSDDSFSVFVKFSDAQDATKQFTIENESLVFLSRTCGVWYPG